MRMRLRYAAAAGAYLQSGVASRHDLGAATTALIDEEIRAFVSRAQTAALAVLNKHLDVLHEVARVLQEKEMISGDELAAIADAPRTPQS